MTKEFLNKLYKETSNKDLEFIFEVKTEEEFNVKVKELNPHFNKLYLIWKSDILPIEKVATEGEYLLQLASGISTVADVHTVKNKSNQEPYWTDKSKLSRVDFERKINQIFGAEFSNNTKDGDIMHYMHINTIDNKKDTFDEYMCYVYMTLQYIRTIDSTSLDIELKDFLLLMYNHLQEK